jgi:hypothetical protein
MTELDTSRFEPMPERTGPITRVLATLFVVFAIGFWAFAFSPWARDIFTAPDQLESDALVADVESLCAAARAQIAELPAASLSTTAAERAAVVAEANSILKAMVADLRLFDPENEDDGRLLGLWLDDWNIYLADRDTHVDRLTNEGDVRFLNTERLGVFIHERMDGFSRVNNLDSCETPGDL